MTKVKVRIPATTANMGPGFDTLGMALKLYNEIEVEETDGKTEIYNKGVKVEEDFRDNLIYKTIIKTMGNNKYVPKGLKINVRKCDVPISRGLGSSSACIVGGIKAADIIMGGNMPPGDIISLATQIEGHPDNVVPASLGGMVISLIINGKIEYSRVNLPKGLKFVAMIPDFHVGTAASRKVLPESYDRQDCVFNVSRAAMLISALNNCELHKLRICFGDRIHQPYRGKLIKNSDEVLEKSKQLGALGEFISGSGSTLMSVLEEKDTNEFVEEMKDFFNDFEDTWNIIPLDPDFEGVKVLEE